MESITRPPAAALQSDQRVVLHNISWGTYERLLEELSDQQFAAWVREQRRVGP